MTTIPILDEDGEALMRVALEPVVGSFGTGLKEVTEWPQ